MKIKKIQKNKAFVILFAVMLSSIILAITLGVSNISLKEINFSTSAKNANDAFFAADTGIECALFYDKTGPNNAFTSGLEIPMNCAGSNITLTPNNTPPTFWSFDIVGLGSNGKSCAKVTVDKDTIPNTTIISKGYNNCILNNKVERELEVTY
ncbi:MAG: hypothetical protein WC264_02890 [Candidatus Paceibacterota bacterium]|jgi:hypothetical protein